MGRFLSALKAGVAGFRQGDEPREYSMAGRPVRCPHCSNSTFGQSQAMLNTRTRTLFNADWLDPSATILVCAECGRIEWFAQEPDAAGS